MSELANLSMDADINEEKDSVGGSGPLSTAIYDMKVALAYLTKSSGGALGMAVHLEGPNNERLRQTIYMTSGDAKGNKNYYIKDGEKFYLPGFNLANSLAQLTLGKDIGKLVPEKKVVNLYSFESKKEEPTEVPVYVELLGQQIQAAVFLQTVDKNAKGDDGKYHPTGETRDENEIDKFFHADTGMTVAEQKAQVETAVFIDTWKGKWTGIVKDKTSKTGPAKTGAPKPAGAIASKPTESLFN